MATRQKRQRALRRRYAAAVTAAYRCGLELELRNRTLANRRARIGFAREVLARLGVQLETVATQPNQQLAILPAPN